MPNSSSLSLFTVILLVSTGNDSIKEIITRSNLDRDSAKRALDHLIKDDQILILDESADNFKTNSLVSSKSTWGLITEKAKGELASYIELYPLRLGMPREELKSRLMISARVFNAATNIWFAEGIFDEIFVRQNLPGISPVPLIHLSGYQVKFSPVNQNLVDKLLTRFANNPYSPPSIKESISEVGDELFNTMIDLGYFIPLSSEVAFRLEDYYIIVERIRSMFEMQDTISVAQVRDAFHTSRRYILAILEHLDSIGMTIRVGDVRKLKS